MITVTLTDEENVAMAEAILIFSEIEVRYGALLPPDRGLALMSATQKFLEATEGAPNDVPTTGPDEGGCAADGDGFSSSGEPAGAGELSIS